MGATERQAAMLKGVGDRNSNTRQRTPYVRAREVRQRRARHAGTGLSTPPRSTAGDPRSTRGWRPRI